MGISVHTAYLSLGSNIGDRTSHLEEAKRALTERIGTIISVSNVYENPPVGFNADQDFLNICLAINTPLALPELLLALKEIEQEMGRKPSTGSGYTSRPIDIDIILYENTVYQTGKLTIPHKEFRKRRFVLMPLNDIASDKIDPETMLTIQQLFENCADQSEMRTYAES